jgi:hypothetical protein
MLIADGFSCFRSEQVISEVVAGRKAAVLLEKVL